MILENRFQPKKRNASSPCAVSIFDMMLFRKKILWFKSVPTNGTEPEQAQGMEWGQ